MPNFICTTCGTQYADSDQPPAACTICQDERQYVKATGQQWTTLDKLRLTNRNSLKFKEPGLIGVGIEPHFAIGQQRALFLRTPKANVLWFLIKGRPLQDPIRRSTNQLHADPQRTRSVGQTRPVGVRRSVAHRTRCAERPGRGAPD